MYDTTWRAFYDTMYGGGNIEQCDGRGGEDMDIVVNRLRDCL